MSEIQKPSYWAVIPADVRYDDTIPANAKLLYGEISSLCDQEGFCYASNGYFAQLYGWSIPTIQRLVKALGDAGHIKITVVRDRRTHAVEERRIFAGLQKGVPPHLKNEVRSPQKKGDPPLKNDFLNKEEQSKYEQYPPTPQGGQGGRKRKKEPRAAPDWKPERFAGLWAYYPQKGRKNKQDAMRAWDDLRPDDDLIALIGQALRKLKASELWKRGVGIPYVGTFLRGERWKDAEAVEDEPHRGEDGGEVFEDRRLL